MLRLAYNAMRSGRSATMAATTLGILMVLGMPVPSAGQATRCPPVCTREQGIQNRLNQSADRFRPNLQRLTIDGGAQVTTTSSVTIEIQATQATHMRISENPDFRGSTWQPFQARFQFPLSTTLGEKTIHVVLANQMNAGNPVGDAPGPMTGVARRVIEYWNPKINSVEVFTRDGSQRISNSASREVLVRLDLLGTATQYRVASLAQDLGSMPWRSDINGRDFALQLADQVGVQRFRVEARNGAAGGSNRFDFNVNYVGSRVFFVSVWEAFQEARSQGWSSSLSGCQPEGLSNSPSETAPGESGSATYQGLSLARHGRGCSGRLFAGRALAPGWTLESDLGTFSAMGRTGFASNSRPGGNRIEMGVDCPAAAGTVRPTSPYDPGGCHIIRLVLRGPANGNWRDAFKR